MKHPDTFQFWASRIVYNKSIDVLNKANKERLELKNFKYSNSIADTDNTENEKLNAQLLKAIKTLPVNHQQVLHLFYLEQYSIVDVAKRLNISKGTAKSRLFYAREKLKLILKSEHYEN
ncbi:RNA polymerase sigma factor [Hanstruepera marina]|uniref:RNA polymerase sigma factor n=1 Tax=Hanstruepera marina TaxID=2873265 RepID=UPI001CA75EAC|nr:sigma-70 family RNA polymerase sigma factor [Hanstruepera marina]